MKKDYNQLNNILAFNPTLIDDLIHKRKTYEGFIVRNGKVYYTPLNLEIIPRENVNELLDTLYKSNDYYINNITAFYKAVREKYGNITRKECEEYLTNNPQYQLQVKKPRTSAPIVALFPNKLWNCDLIDMGEHHKDGYYRYIFVIVDVFSRRIFLQALTNKEARTCKTALDTIITRVGIQCKLLMADNGGEFEREFKEYCDENHIHLIHTRSYSPQANGIVENKNKQIRKVLKSFMLRNNNPRWKQYVPLVEDNINNQYSSAIKASPNQIWKPTNEPLNIGRLLPETLENHTDKIKKVYRINRQKIHNFKEQDNYKVGDKVRIKMTTLYSNLRKMVKAGEGKNIIVHYTPDVFHIHKVIIVRNKKNIERKRYWVTTLADDYIFCDKNQKTKVFYATDLQKLSDDADHYDNMTLAQALRLNKCEENQNDIIVKAL